jgi:hypothetical protein
MLGIDKLYLFYGCIKLYTIHIKYMFTTRKNNVFNLYMLVCVLGQRPLLLKLNI